MTKPTILVDIDDTLNQFAATFWNIYNEVYDENQDYKKVDSWNLQDYARDDIHVYDLLKHPGIFRHIPLKEYATQFIKRLYENYEVYIVSDSPSGTSHCELNNHHYSNPADDKRKWVKEHFPFFPQDQVIFCSHKWMVTGDLLIDDKPAMFEKFQALGRKSILIDMPYNRHIETKWRAKDLMEAERMVQEILS